MLKFMTRPWFCYSFMTVLVGCGQADKSATCYSIAITYGGIKTGTFYIRLAGDNGKTGVSEGGPIPSIQDAMFIYRGATSCFYRAVDPGDLPISADAWIDVAGDDAAACADIHSAQCQPSTSDPQAHQNAVLHFGETTVVHLDLADP